MKRLFDGLWIGLMVLATAQIIFDFGPIRPGQVEVVEAKEEKEKSNAPDQYEKYFLERITMVGKEYHGYKPGYRINEYEKLQRSNFRTARTKSINWTERGPSNVPGRTRGLILMPDDPAGNTWLVGSAGGGIWKTTNSGGSWTNKTTNLPNLATTAIAVCTTSPDVIYAGTGEGQFHSGSIKGDGVFKSTDGGETWTHLASTIGDVRFQNVNAIIVDPNNPDIVLLCSNGFPPFASDIMKSTDGGSTWSEMYNGVARIQQIIADPNNFTIQYATINNEGSAKGILKSTDSGDTWTLTGFGLFAEGRVSVTVSPVNPNRMFAVAESDLNSVGSEVFVSDDAGETWTSLGEEDGSAHPNWLGNLGWYANSIQAHPFDEDVVYIGGVDIYKATLAGGTSEKPPRLLGYQEIGTQDFMAFQPTQGLSFVGLGTGEEWFDGHEGFPVDREVGDFRAVEIRFGPGKSQLAYRFIVDPNDGTNNDGGAGVAPLGYLYQDYIEVPFEVWDLDNNQQLMVSFRDQERDGEWNLIARDPEDPVPGREYILVHPVPYSETPDSNIAKNGGQGYKTIFSMWPILAEDGTFDPDNLPESKLFINYSALVLQNSNHVIVNNSGGTWTPASNGVHPDIHNIQFHSTAASTFKMVVASDGGIFYSQEEQVPGETTDDWSHAFNGNNTTQFYSIDKSAGQSKYIGGTQDNGTWLNENINADASTRYTHKLGGDGFDAIWNYEDANRMIGSSQNNQFRRSDDGGVTWVASRTGLDDVGDPAAPFFSVIENHKALPNTLMAVGETGVWISKNFGERWESSPISSRWVTEGGITSSHTVVFSKANPNIVWAGGGMTSLRNMHVSTNRGATFSEVPNVADTIGSISGFATHPTEENTAYALFSFNEYGKVFRTKDLGGSWEDISGFNGNTISSTGFPDVAISTLLVLPHEPTTIWVGTEIGVVESTDDGKTWHMLEGNMPAVSVWELRAIDDQVLAATHGRGVWSASFPTMDWPGDLEVIAGIESEPLSSIATVYPNPASDYVNIRFEGLEPGPALLSIVQTDGKQVLQKRIEMQASGELRLPVTTIPEGVLIMSLQKSGVNYSTRLIIRR